MIEEQLKKIRSKSIAVVYTYKNETAIGFEHYDYWSMNVISDWAKAIEEISCIPYIVDVRTFGDKALNNTLPPIDLVVNLNAGNYDLSTLGLVPSICGFLSIPCIPCETSPAVTGENKRLSNLIAKALFLNVPEECSSENRFGIFRPLNLGSSKGIIRGKIGEESGIYQEFINGFDMTTPILYNPLSGNLEILPSISYLSNTNTTNWFLNADEKATIKNYIKKPIQIDSKTQETYLALAKAFGVKTFCRIDARIKCNTIEERDQIVNQIVPNDRVFFLEINTMPTISEKINFCNAIESINEESSFHESYSEYKEVVSNPSTVGFILFCSILALNDLITRRYR